MTPEMMPYVQLAGFFVVLCGFILTIGTIVFYGGKFTEQHKHHGERIENIESDLYDRDGIKERVTIHHQILTGQRREV